MTVLLSPGASVQVQVEGFRLNGRRFIGQHLPAHVVAEP